MGKREQLEEVANQAARLIEKYGENDRFSAVVRMIEREIRDTISLLPIEANPNDQ